MGIRKGHSQSLALKSAFYNIVNCNLFAIIFESVKHDVMADSCNTLLAPSKNVTEIEQQLIK